MSIPLRKKTGAAIAVVGAIVAAMGILDHSSVPTAVAVAVVCIVIGTGVARGRSGPPDGRNCE